MYVLIKNLKCLNLNGCLSFLVFFSKLMAWSPQWRELIVHWSKSKIAFYAKFSLTSKRHLGTHVNLVQGPRSISKQHNWVLQFLESVYRIGGCDEAIHWKPSMVYHESISWIWPPDVKIALYFIERNPTFSNLHVKESWGHGPS